MLCILLNHLLTADFHIKPFTFLYDTKLYLKLLIKCQLGTFFYKMRYAYVFTN